MNNFILALLSEKNKLKATSLYQILIGKRTSSTLAYAFFNDLLPFLGMLPTLSNGEFQQAINQLKQERFIEINNQGDLIRTKVESTINLNDFSMINYYRYGRMTTIGWRLVQYLIQVVSCENQTHNTTVYAETGPFYVEEVKRVMTHYSREVAAKQANTELIAFFSQVNSQQANLLASSLSGGEYIGKTFYQLFESSDTPLLNELKLANAIHAFFKYFFDEKETMFHLLLKNLYAWNLNQSLILTRRLFLQGKSLSEIARLRNLKESTIRDHIIEWAILDDEFPFNLFNMNDVHNHFLNLKIPAWTFTFKEVNQTKSVDFLAFRLYQIERKRESNARR